jgi:hypothetical protein
MTIEDFTRRLGASLALSGVFLLVTAFVCWVSIGDGDGVVHSIHNVAGFVLAVFGVVFVAVGLALGAVVPPAETK